jgi:hypothetical protein
MRSPLHRFIPLLSLISLLPLASSAGQGRSVADSSRNKIFAPARFVDDPGEEDSRSLLLRGSGAWPLFRSTSSLTPAFAGPGPHFGLVAPAIRFVDNSALPYSLNDGALWAGRGLNTQVVAGARAEWGRVRAFILPEWWRAENRDYDVTASPRLPPPPGTRSEWYSPFNPGSASIDMPIRFGSEPIRRIGWGQSTLLMTAGAFDVGVSTENEWWGPGLRNALLLSNNAAGFGHLFGRTAHPVKVPFGSLEARWIAGRLTQSDFFDTTGVDGDRTIALLGVTYMPDAVTGLTVGAARAVFAPGKTGDVPGAAFDVFRNVGTPDARALGDTNFTPGPDQLLSLFWRWAFPGAGLETYGEWGRAEFPTSLRDFLEEPNHTQAYTLGVQWLGHEIAATRGRLRVQGEATFVQQSTTFRFRPIGSWYASHSVIQGYTEQGQVLGAGIGPGSSSQWVAVDHLNEGWRIGGYVNRIRWLEDSHSQYFTPAPGSSWCESDVSLLGGIRAGANTRGGSLALDYSTGWRYDVFFQHDPGTCPNNQGVDRRNQSLSISFRPAIRF